MSDREVAFRCGECGDYVHSHPDGRPCVAQRKPHHSMTDRDKDKPTLNRAKLIWRGDERYPYPLSILSEDHVWWIARDGTVSSKESARLLVASWNAIVALANHLNVDPVELAESLDLVKAVSLLDELLDVWDPEYEPARSLYARATALLDNLRGDK